MRSGEKCGRWMRVEDGRPGGLETKDARKRIFSFSFVFASRLLGETYLGRFIGSVKMLLGGWHEGRKVG